VNSNPPPPDPAQVVLTFLESIGQRSDAELYLGLFRRLPKESFALVVADSQVAAAASGSLVEQLRFLAELGLFAPVVLGAFRQAKGHAEARRLSQQLPLAGLKSSVHSAEEPDLPDALRQELRQEVIPLVYFNSASDNDLSTRLQRVGRLASSLDSRKLVILRPQGGLRPKASAVTLVGDEVTPATGGGRGISVVNLRTDYAALRQGSALFAHDAELLGHVHDVLLSVPEGQQFAVSITSPLNMLRELFTVRGAGTLIKAGTRIDCLVNYDTLDKARVQSLLEDTFGRRLRDEFWQRPTRNIYLEQDYRGIAIVHDSPLGPFLTKFAVSRVAQGEGMGRDLWAALTRDHPKLFWRAKRSNPITAWYTTHCQGMVKVDLWTVFWRGLEPRDVPSAIDYACSLPEDFEAAAERN
jgi:acetylglutamate kinase